MAYALCIWSLYTAYDSRVEYDTRHEQGLRKALPKLRSQYILILTVYYSTNSQHPTPPYLCFPFHALIPHPHPRPTSSTAGPRCPYPCLRYARSRSTRTVIVAVSPARSTRGRGRRPRSRMWLLKFPVWMWWRFRG